MITLAKISVIVPTYNMGIFCPEAVNSIFKNNFDDFEIIVVDDGSTDNSQTLISRFINTRPVEHKKKIVFLTQTHKGKPAAVNRALQDTSGEFITILDADDKLTPTSLQIRYEKAIESNAEIVLGGFQTFNGQNILGYRNPPKTQNKDELINKLLFDIKSPFSLNCSLISKELLNRVGTFDERLLRGQDKDFAIRLIREARRIEIIHESVYMYRRYKRGYVKKLKSRWITIGYKSMVIVKHTSGIKRMAAIIWGAIVEIGKMGYELFGIYKK